METREPELGTLPAEWEVAALCDKYVFTQKPRGLRYDSFESIPFVPMELIPFRKIAFHNYTLKKPNEFSSGTYFEAGDFLLPKITPSFENGKQGIIPELPNGFGVATTEVIPIKQIDGVSDTGYLFYYLLKDDVRSALAGKMEGSTGRQRLSKAVVESLHIPFPPLAEQRAIARVLSTIQRAIETQDKLVSAARELKKSLLRQLFTQGLDANGAVKETEIGVMPEHWEPVAFGDVVQIATGQIDPRQEPYLHMLHIGPENIESGSGRILEPRTAEELRLISGNYFFTPEDVLYSKIRPYLRKAAVPTFSGTCSADIYPLKPKSNDLDRVFLFYFLLTDPFTKHATSFQSRTRIPKINREQLGQARIPIPLLSEQREIARILATVDKKIETEEKRRAALQTLFKTMLQQLMTGQIRVLAMKNEG